MYPGKASQIRLGKQWPYPRAYLPDPTRKNSGPYSRAYLRGRFTEELLRIKELLKKYEGKYEERNLADELQMEPLGEGETVVDVGH